MTVADPRAIARELEDLHDPRAIVARLGAAFAAEIERAQVAELCAIREALAERSALADTLFAMQGLGSYPITLAGGPKERVKEIAAGKKIAAFAITEPEAGSDVGAIATRATQAGDGWQLDGEKTFISNAGIADSYVVFAKTNESISAFLVDAGAAGLSAEPLELLAEHPIGTLRFSKCPARLLGQEGAGLKLALGTLDVFRSDLKRRSSPTPASPIRMSYSPRRMSRSARFWSMPARRDFRRSRSSCWPSIPSARCVFPNVRRAFWVKKAPA